MPGLIYICPAGQQTMRESAIRQGTEQPAMSLEERPELKRIHARTSIRLARDAPDAAVGEPTREVRFLVPPHLEGRRETT